jgi:hypothetical protein
MRRRTNRTLIILIACFSLVGVGNASATNAHIPKGFWNPMLKLPASVRARFACVMNAESHSTWTWLNLGDDNRNGSSGIFQIEQSTFLAYQSAAGVPLRTKAGKQIHVWQASAYQQELVAIAIYKADGFGPWTRYDGC